MERDRIRIGCGAGFADDRIPPGVEIVERGDLDYLAMECLAERTIARETLDRAKDPAKGYTPVLLERMEAIMPPALQRGIKIVTNMGAANPMGAARAVRKHAVDWDCPDYTCAVVTGDEVTDVMRAHPELPLMETGEPLEEQALDDRSDRADDQRREDEGPPIVEARIVEQEISGEGPHHVERAVGEVDDRQHAENDRKPEA